MAKGLRRIMAETASGVWYNVKQWLANTGCSIHGWQMLVNSHVFPFDGTRDSILTNIDCMCRAGEKKKKKKEL